MTLKTPLLSLPDGYAWDESLQLGEETARLTSLVSPNFLIEPSDIPDPALQFELTEEQVALRFPNWGIRRRKSDDVLVACLSAILISADLTRDEFPDQGWQFAMQSASRKDHPNCMCLVAANVDPSVRGFGFSTILIEKAKDAARALGFSTLIAPVRPVLKSDFPFMPMNDYLAKRTAENEIYDPWVRTHVKCGGQILNVCGESVVVTATLSKWEEWTGLRFVESKDYTLPRALASLQVDIEKKIGVYREPNVWIRYRL